MIYEHLMQEKRQSSGKSSSEVDGETHSSSKLSNLSPAEIQELIKEQPIEIQWTD